MKIKKGDTVLVITGKDKGKKGKVLSSDAGSGRVVVEGVNIQTKHAKATMGQPSEIRKQEGPVDVSNVMFWDAKAKAPTRIGYKFVDGKKKRVSVRTGQVVD